MRKFLGAFVSIVSRHEDAAARQSVRRVARRGRLFLAARMRPHAKVCAGFAAGDGLQSSGPLDRGLGE
jgi:hypothetical protein